MFVCQIILQPKQGVMDVSQLVNLKSALVVKLYGIVEAHARAEWKLHRLECEVLSRLEKNKRKSVTPSIRLMVKLYLRRKLLREKVIPSTATDNYNLVEALVARVYPAVHPLLGLQYYTCGKLEWYLGDTEGTVKSLAKAVDVLRITHGTNTPFMKELFMKLEKARAEASYE